MSVVVATRHPDAYRVEPVAVGDADLGQEDLVELGVAGHLAQRPYLDAGSGHVEDEVGKAPVLRHVGIGSRDEHAEAGRRGRASSRPSGP